VEIALEPLAGDGRERGGARRGAPMGDGGDALNRDEKVVSLNRQARGKRGVSPSPRRMPQCQCGGTRAVLRPVCEARGGRARTGG
jgi:hypothetical protein